MTALLHPASPETLAEAAAHLRGGGLVAFPTETVYGLGADARNGQAVASVFAAKGRPQFNPLIVHVPSLESAETLAVFDDRARAVARRFWPGPLTLVLPRRADSGVSDLVSAGLATVALRVPAHPLAQELLRRAGVPIAAPSANRSGRLSPTQAAHVAASLPEGAAYILDGGACPVGLESTVIDLSGEPPALLRPGGLPRAEIEALTGPLLVATEDNTAPRSPGQLLSHYAPGLPLRLNATQAKAGEALLGFGPVPPGQTVALSLSATGDTVEAAAALFSSLHQLDDPARWRGIAVMPIADDAPGGLGPAINDRLRRAAGSGQKACVRE